VFVKIMLYQLQKIKVKCIREAPPGIEKYHDATISEKYLLEKFEE
jgi:hypothetical protein